MSISKNLERAFLAFDSFSEQTVGDVWAKPLENDQAVAGFFLGVALFKCFRQLFTATGYAVRVQSAHKHRKLQTNAEILQTLVNLAAQSVARYVVTNERDIIPDAAHTVLL
jgi:hypothetical protein